MTFPGLNPPYCVLYADPPWQFRTYSDKGRDRCPDAPVWGRGENNKPERHYATMTFEEIRALPVASLAARDCALFMWAVDSMIPQVVAVGEAWGFTYKTVGFYWAKMRREGSLRGLQQHETDKQLFPMGTGYWTRSNPEVCLLFTRGSPKRKSRAVRKLIIAPRREHSRKPDEARERIESLVDGPYCELFARHAAPGWDAWGDQLSEAA